MLRIALLLVLATTACAEERKARKVTEKELAQIEEHVRTLADAEKLRKVAEERLRLAGPLEAGRKVKAELDKVYRSSTDYDLTVSSTTPGHPSAAALDAMPHVSIGDVTVGYEESSNRSFGGLSYAKHFRASWKRGPNDVVHVSYLSKEELDLVAFVALLEKLVPIVNDQRR